MGEEGHVDQLFINGEAVTDLPDSRFVAKLADHRQLGWEDLQDWLADADNLEWLCQQIAQGFWLIMGEEDDAE